MKTRKERRLKEHFVYHTRELKKRNSRLCKEGKQIQLTNDRLIEIKWELIELGIQPDYLTFVNELKAEL